MARVWWSNKPTGFSVTLVTQLSVARLHQLQAQCATWRGPLAAAIFLPLVNPESQLNGESSTKLLQAMASVQHLFSVSESAGANSCQLRLVLMYELFHDDKSARSLYPVNTLRNYARLMADTELITNIDVDLLPSLSISTAMSNPAILANYTSGCRAGGAYVWPAFQTNCRGAEFTDSIAKDGKDGLQKAIKDTAQDQCVTTFDHKFPIFHNATLYDKWFGAQEPYTIHYHLHFEPWYLSWRWTTPWFDFRYRGYGYNKCVQAAAMNATGATWLVSPHGFVIHRPHDPTSMRKSFIFTQVHEKRDAHFRHTMYGHVEALWNTAQSDMLLTGRLEMRVEDSFRLCLRQLPWWRRPESLPGAATEAAGARGAPPSPPQAAVAGAWG